MNSWVLWVLVSWGLSSLIYIGSPVNYPPFRERVNKFISISVAGIVGGFLGGAIFRALSPDPMPGFALVSVLAGSAILSAALLVVTGKGQAAH